MTPLQQLRAAGLEVFVQDGCELYVTPKALATDALVNLASDNRELILADLAEEEAFTNGKARSRPSS